MRDFIEEYPPDFMISAKCCDYCKKQIAHKVQKSYDMVITGERRDEGGMRSVPRKDNTALCFTETASGQYRLRPLYLTKIRNGTKTITESSIPMLMRYTD